MKTSSISVSCVSDQFQAKRPGNRPKKPLILPANCIRTTKSVLVIYRFEERFKSFGRCLAIDQHTNLHQVNRHQGNLHQVDQVTVFTAMIGFSRRSVCNRLFVHKAFQILDHQCLPITHGLTLIHNHWIHPKQKELLHSPACSKLWEHLALVIFLFSFDCFGQNQAPKMTPKPTFQPPFLCASDYVFYIKKNSELDAEPSINKHNKMSTLLRKLSEDICEGPVG